MTGKLQKIAVGLHGKIRDSGASPPSVAVIKYALHIIFSTALTIVAALVIGSIIGTLAETALVLVAFCAIRYVSGGFHLKSSVWCSVASIGLLAVIPLVPISSALTYGLTAGSCVVMVILAPCNFDKYARIPEQYYPLLKAIAFGMVAANFAIGSELLAITYTIQAALMLPYIRGRFV